MLYLHLYRPAAYDHHQLLWRFVHFSLTFSLSLSLSFLLFVCLTFSFVRSMISSESARHIASIKISFSVRRSMRAQNSSFKERKSKRERERKIPETRKWEWKETKNTKFCSSPVEIVSFFFFFFFSLNWYCSCLFLFALSTGGHCFYSLNVDHPLRLPSGRKKNKKWLERMCLSDLATSRQSTKTSGQCLRLDVSFSLTTLTFNGCRGRPMSGDRTPALYPIVLFASLSLSLSLSLSFFILQCRFGDLLMFNAMPV